MHAMLQDVHCDPSQSIEAIRKLAKRLVETRSLDKHWSLIPEIHTYKPDQIFRFFAHYISASWCGNGERKHDWQMWAILPRNIRCSEAEQKKGYAEVVKAARLLETALRNTAVSPRLCDSALGVVADVNRAQDDNVELMSGLDFFKGNFPIRDTRPVVALPLARSRSHEDSVLTRLIRAANLPEINYAKGWVGRPNATDARITYFARNLAQILRYEIDGVPRPRIEDFIADLITVLVGWENGREDWDAARVRQCLRKMKKRPSVQSKKIS